MAALDFHGQTVWVTGAGKGIGYATALAFVEAGLTSPVSTLPLPAQVIRLPPKRWTSPMPTRYATCARGCSTTSNDWTCW